MNLSSLLKENQPVKVMEVLCLGQISDQQVLVCDASSVGMFVTQHPEKFKKGCGLKFIKPIRLGPETFSSGSIMPSVRKSTLNLDKDQIEGYIKSYKPSSPVPNPIKMATMTTDKKLGKITVKILSVLNKRPYSNGRSYSLIRCSDGTSFKMIIYNWSDHCLQFSYGDVVTIKNLKVFKEDPDKFWASTLKGTTILQKNDPDLKHFFDSVQMGERVVVAKLVAFTNLSFFEEEDFKVDLVIEEQEDEEALIVSFHKDHFQEYLNGDVEESLAKLEDSVVEVEFDESEDKKYGVKFKLTQTNKGNEDVEESIVKLESQV